MDNRFRNGLLSYEQRFHRDSKTRGGCPTRASHVLVEVSSTYFDYPKAPLRVAGVLPAVRIAVVLREPVGRALSAYNVRWMTWLCGKLLWQRADCWAAVTSEEEVRKAQVGPFQMHAALKLWRSCASGKSGAPALRCLQQDYVTKLRNKTEVELRALRRCASRAEDATTPASIDWMGCLHLRSVMLGPKQIHKVMEDSSFVWRSMYATHLRVWLRLFTPSQILVVDPSSLLSRATAPATMRRLASFAAGSASSIAVDDAALMRDDVLTSPSPGAVELGDAEGVHENARRYILGKRPIPADITRALREWFRPHACDLAGLLRRHRLLGGDDGDELPWLREELQSGGGGVCAGVTSLDEWFIGA